MTAIIFRGLMLPLLGTSLGAACVFCMKDGLRPTLQRALLGFAAGVMAAACVWSLLLPAIAQASAFGRLAFLPAAIGFCTGLGLPLLFDREHAVETERGSLLIPAVVLHNIPEGMAVGAAFAGLHPGYADSSLSGAMLLSVGIAVQNFPEGAIISMPLAAKGLRRSRAFFCGVLSGLVEPIAGALTVLLSGLLVPVLPYLLSFAAGAMQYVVLAELVPEITAHGKVGLPLFAAGFVVMMALDVSFG